MPIKKIKNSILTKLSIKNHIILGVTLVHAILMAMFIQDIHTKSTFKNKEALFERAQSLVSILSLTVRPWVLSRDLAELEEVITAQKKIKDLESAFVSTLV